MSNVVVIVYASEKNLACFHFNKNGDIRIQRQQYRYEEKHCLKCFVNLF